MFPSEELLRAISADRERAAQRAMLSGVFLQEQETIGRKTATRGRFGRWPRAPRNSTARGRGIGGAAGQAR
ncbi:MAG: hypothetical protein ACRDG3_05120 [Tepidiformaceae bacterium]